MVLVCFSQGDWAPFHMFISHLFLLWINVCLVLWPTFWLGCLFFWYWAACAARIFFEINSFSIVLVAIIFSHSDDGLFTLLKVSFIVQKLLSFIRPHLFIFAFISIALGDGHRGSYCDLCQRVFCLFSSRSFIVSVLTFRSLIHFEFIFVYGVSVLVSFCYKWLTSFPSTTC